MPLELTLPAAPPPNVTEVTDASHVMLSAAGIRMRRSCAAVIVGVEPSVTISVLAADAACPTVNVWLAAEDSVPGEVHALIGIAASALSFTYPGVQLMATVPVPVAVPSLCHVWLP